MTAFHEQLVESIAVCFIVLLGVRVCYISAPKFSEKVHIARPYMMFCHEMYYFMLGRRNH